jgi:hypothetical protein
MYLVCPPALEMLSGAFGGNAQIRLKKVVDYIDYNCLVRVEVLGKGLPITACVDLVGYTGAWLEC